jgi:hypothetical protein
MQVARLIHRHQVVESVAIKIGGQPAKTEQAELRIPLETSSPQKMAPVPKDSA